MTTLAELLDPVECEKFDQKVVEIYINSKTDEVALNDGCLSSQDLIKRVKEGSHIKFDFGRLMREANEYT